MYPTVEDKLRAAKTVHFFQGDRTITAMTAEGEMISVRPTFDGSGDVRAAVRDEVQVKRTRQYKVMTALGFRPIDRFWMLYKRETDKGVIKVRFYNSRIKELLVNDIPVKHVSVEMGVSDEGA
jgi:hypothetical protein